MRNEHLSPPRREARQGFRGIRKQWIEPQDVEVPTDLQDAVGGYPLVAQVLARRGLKTVEQARAFLDPDHYCPTSAHELPNMARAVERLERALQQGEKICVWGDFDVDGQTATTVLVSTLKELGAQVTFHIPIRETESHGVNLPVLKEVIAAGAELLLTCDTGIAAHEAATYAKSQSLDLIITDHHDIPEQLPEALAVINPKLLPEGQNGQPHPLATLPGVGVAYKLAEALYERAGRPEAVEKHLDLAALGIVADIALQRGDTRYLLQRGLKALRSPKRLGLQAMMKLAELDPDFLTEEHIGFVLAPRLNALGRLSDANQAVEFLTARDPGRARVLATQFEGLNAQRQLLTSQVFQGAQAQIERDPSLLDGAALVLAHPHWPAGVIGIVASQLVEHYGKPVVLISAPPDGPGRGSARSVEGVNITAAIAAQAELLERFGGHPMAAGLAIRANRIDEFREGLSRAVAEMLGEVQLEPHLNVDAYLRFSDLSLNLVEDLERLSPFGPGNPALTLASKNLILRNHTTVGRNGEHRRLIVEDEDGSTQNIIWWSGSTWPVPKDGFDLAYRVRASDFRGQREIQVEWIEARPVEAAIASIQEKAIEVLDYRHQPQPALALKNIDETDLQVWCEAESVGKLAELGITPRDRYSLAPGEALAIWTVPPGPVELQIVLERVDPNRVHIFGIEPESTGVESFIRRLAGLVKFALKDKGGRVSILKLASATAQREAAVRKGLAWMAAKGHIHWDEENDDLVLKEGGKSTGDKVVEITRQLESILHESSAYRTHFARAKAEDLVRQNQEE
jgi:single-stranded-DNA-specific exonuclease